MSDVFFALKRLKALREMMGKSSVLSHGSPLDHAVIEFLRDLAKDIAARFAIDPEEAYFFLVRCMGVIVQADAEDAYEPYGYDNPFASPPAATGPVFGWKIDRLPDQLSSGSSDKEAAKPISALKMFGYTVGKKGREQGWTEVERRKFLSDFMEMDLPLVVHAYYGDEYGEPMSIKRLQKIANVIAAHGTNFARRGDPAFNQSIADWEADLAFLKAKYYEGKGLKFQPWPEVERK